MHKGTGMIMGDLLAAEIQRLLPGCKLYAYWPGQQTISVVQLEVNGTKINAAIDCAEGKGKTAEEIADMFEVRLIAGVRQLLRGKPS